MPEFYYWPHHVVVFFGFSAQKYLASWALALHPRKLAVTVDRVCCFTLQDIFYTVCHFPTNMTQLNQLKHVSEDRPIIPEGTWHIKHVTKTWSATISNPAWPFSGDIKGPFLNLKKSRGIWKWRGTAVEKGGLFLVSAEEIVAEERDITVCLATGIFQRRDPDGRAVSMSCLFFH